MRHPSLPIAALALVALGCSREPTCPDLAHADSLKRVLEGQAGPCELAAVDEFIADRSALRGPWRQELRVATSADGRTFADQGPLGLGQAAVAEVVVGPQGRYHLFYVDGALENLRRRAPSDADWLRRHGLPGIGALALATSEDGRTWTREEAFGVDGLVLGMVVDPEVVRLPDGSWRMYYVGMPIQAYREHSWDEGTPHEVFYAHSLDLVHWRQEGRAVLGPFADPTVRCGLEGDPQRCELISFGLDRSTSTDGGTSFDYLGPMEVPGFGPEVMDLGGGRHRLVFNSKAPGAPMHALVSQDGGPWSPEEGELMPGSYGEAPSFFRLPDGTWAMAYHSFSSPEDLPDEARHLVP